MMTATRGMIVEFLDGRVTVGPDDEDEFARFAQDAMKVSRSCPTCDRPIRAFKHDLLAPLREWCERRSAQINACYVPVPQGHLEAYVIGTSEQSDFKLGHEVAELSLAFLDRGIHLLVMPIPNSADEGSFCHFSPEGAILVYANPKPTPYQGPR